MGHDGTSAMGTRPRASVVPYLEIPVATVPLSYPLSQPLANPVSLSSHVLDDFHLLCTRPQYDPSERVLSISPQLAKLSAFLPRLTSPFETNPMLRQNSHACHIADDCVWELEPQFTITQALLCVCVHLSRHTGL
jgi:hypothetical protein